MTPTDYVIPPRRRTGLRPLALTAAAAVVAGGAVLLLPAASAAAADAPAVSCTIDSSELHTCVITSAASGNAVVPLTLPDGVQNLHVALVGGNGAQGQWKAPPKTPGAGGVGGTVVADLTVQVPNLYIALSGPPQEGGRGGQAVFVQGARTFGSAIIAGAAGGGGGGAAVTLQLPQDGTPGGAGGAAQLPRGYSARNYLWSDGNDGGNDIWNNGVAGGGNSTGTTVAGGPGYSEVDNKHLGGDGGTGCTGGAGGGFGRGGGGGSSCVATNAVARGAAQPTFGVNSNNQTASVTVQYFTPRQLFQPQSGMCATLDQQTIKYPPVTIQPCQTTGAPVSQKITVGAQDPTTGTVQYKMHSAATNSELCLGSLDYRSVGAPIVGEPCVSGPTDPHWSNQALVPFNGPTAWNVDGTYTYGVRQLASGRYIDTANASTIAGTPLVLGQDTHGSTQNWSVPASLRGAIAQQPAAIRPWADQNQCATVNANDTRVLLQNCVTVTDTPEQQEQQQRQTFALVRQTPTGAPTVNVSVFCNVYGRGCLGVTNNAQGAVVTTTSTAAAAVSVGGVFTWTTTPYPFSSRGSQVQSNINSGDGRTRYLDTSGGSTTSGTPLVIGTVTGSDTQQWVLPTST